MNTTSVTNLPILLAGKRSAGDSTVGQMFPCAGGCGEMPLVTTVENIHLARTRRVLVMCSKCTLNVNGVRNIR